MTMHKYRFILAAALAVCAAASAQTPITLQQAVDIGMEKNPVRKAALAEQRAAMADVREARAAFLPSVNFSEAVTRSNDPVYAFGTKLKQGRFTNSDFALDALNTPSPLTNFSTRVGGNWAVFDSFTTALNLRRARQMSQMAAQQLTRTDQELVFRVVDSYYGLLLAAKQAELAEQTLKTAEALAENAKARVDSGLVVESDSLAAQVTLASRKQDLIAATNGVALAQAQLSLALGMPAETAYQPSEPLAERTLASPALDQVEAWALAQRPELKQAELQSQAQQTGVKLVKSAMGPRINAFGGWEADSHSFASNGSNSWLAGAELQIDLFSGQKFARLAHEKAMLERAIAMKQAASDGIRLEVRKAFYDHDTARQMIEVARASVAQSEEGLRITQTRYEAGLAPMTELLRSEDAARAARTNYWHAVYRYQTSYAALELATGSLTPQSLLVTQ